MRVLRSAAALTFAATVLVACGSAPMSASLDSGVAGRITLGPTCPVQQVGKRCEHGYRTTMAVYTADGHRFVMKFRSAHDGHFRARAAPGRYTLEAASPRRYPRLRPTTVTVHAHRFAHVTLAFDTGIR